MNFVDTNIMIDMLDEADPWFAWSADTVALARVRARLVINTVVLAEFSRRYADLAKEFLDRVGVTVQQMSDTAAFRAGQAVGAYRRAGGQRHAILADFLIGGHAVDLGATLITRDRQRFASYFPDLTLITPETDHG